MHSSAQHGYGTRIRQNSILKPSARLRQSPDPPAPHKKSKPLPVPFHPTTPPVFPPQHVMLHPEDANSKVFLAIGRAFLAVNNCAMTIKDLAEMSLKFGLVCQNVSAAGQAITTYIRTHMQRCDAQQDHPLLLRHILSGTPSDDDLLPALHSRSGGAHCTANSDNRATNFRRGTMVWYLSKATGAPCPFARAGIRLCEYGENGRVGSPTDARERKRERDRQRRLEICGQKRKRLLRGCLDPDSDSDSACEGKPPPKVKLLLRLRPCSSALTQLPPLRSPAKDSDSDGYRDDSISSDDDDDDDDNDNDQPTSNTNNSPEQPWSLPPYPRRSISIPCYTPSIETSCPYPISQPSHRRSPSVPYSFASPPPNSEDEDDDYHITMTGSRRFSADRRRDRADTDFDLDFDLDSDNELDGETQWESPGPRSPSAPLSNGLVANVVVKQEPRDVQGMLDAWHDFDFGVIEPKVGKGDTGLLYPESTSTVKVESLDIWDWQTADKMDWSSSPFEGEPAPNIKQEELDIESRLFPDELSLGGTEYDLSSPLSSLSPHVTERRHTWADAGSDQAWQIRSQAQTSISLPSFTAPSSFAALHREHPTSTSFTIRARDSDLNQSPTSPSSSFIASLVQSMTMTSLEPQNDTISPSSLLIPPEIAASSQPLANAANVVVVRTCQPCSPPVSATQVEGIPVYQMTLASSSLLRRIDTDFVNISPIVDYLGIPAPLVTSMPNAVIISKGSATVCGTWVPLAFAQTLVREHLRPNDSLGVFLSDSLFEYFPTALQDFHRSNAPGRLLNQFGPHFRSTWEVHRHGQLQLSLRTDVPTLSLNRMSWAAGRESEPEWDVHDNSSNGQPPVLREADDAHIAAIIDTPLSATEQEMFHALCAIPDWEKENSPPAAAPATAATSVSPSSPPCKETSVVEALPGHASSRAATDRPLRRSKRVANAMAVAARSRTGPCRRSARNSLN